MTRWIKFEEKRSLVNQFFCVDWRNAVHISETGRCVETKKKGTFCSSVQMIKWENVYSLKSNHM